MTVLLTFLFVVVVAVVVVIQNMRLIAMAFPQYMRVIKTIFAEVLF